MNWIACSDQLPPNETVVATKIDDANGVRNVTTLMRIGALWFYPDRSGYVYYAPTHWMPESESIEGVVTLEDVA